VAAVRNGTAGVALVNMGSTLVRATGVEEALAGRRSVVDAAQQADAGLDPPADLNASSEYRRHLAKVLVRRALEESA
jgi:carbon-monoxide dehydrogenase medium subunit